jgi:hypothetical protein
MEARSDGSLAARRLEARGEGSGEPGVQEEESREYRGQAKSK